MLHIRVLLILVIAQNNVVFGKNSRFYKSPNIVHNFFFCSNADPFNELYKVSYMWYSAIGCISVVILGIILSLLSGVRDITKIDPRLISPLIHWMNCIPVFSKIGSNYVSFYNS